MSDQWTDRLSEYLDGDLTEAERAAVEAHLEDCRECAETLAGLRRIVMRARSLEDRPPAHDLWSGIAKRIGAPERIEAAPRRRRIAFSVPQLLAAGIALAVLSGGSVWLLRSSPSSVAVQPTPGPQNGAAITHVGLTTVKGYDAAVNDLEQVLAQGRGKLDTATVRILEQNLAIIDRAIAQARQAVAADSANLYLNSHLAETMRRKIDLLRQAATLVSAES
jgi:hypothetical protein